MAKAMEPAEDDVPPLEVSNMEAANSGPWHLMSDLKSIESGHIHDGALPCKIPGDPLQPLPQATVQNWVGSVSSDAGAQDAFTAAVREKMRGYTMELDLLRGVKISRTLKRVGRVWRVRPSEVDNKGKMDMYGLSEEIDERNLLSYFISHSWRSSGVLKYISLLIRFNWVKGVIGGLASLVLVFVLEVCEVLPTFQTFKYAGGYMENGWEGDIPWGHWCTIICPAFALLCLFSSPYLPENKGEPLVFLDQVCIHQVDAEKKKNGIYSLAGFLRNSKEMLILWTPPYFSRLWCVFELAAFWQIHRANIVFRPIFVESALLTWYVYIWVVALFLNLGTPTAVRRRPVVTFISIMFMGFAPAVVALPAIRSFMRDKHQLDKQISKFDCHEADAFAKDDVDFIFKRINYWYGNAENFNKVVRHDLRSMIRRRVRNYYMEYTCVLPIVFPFICHLFDILSGLLIAQPPARVLCIYVARLMVSWFGVVPNLICIYFLLAELFAEKRCIWLLDFGINIAITLSISGICTACLWFYASAYKYNFGWKSNTCILLFCVVLTWVLFFRHVSIRKLFQDLRDGQQGKDSLKAGGATTANELGEPSSQAEGLGNVHPELAPVSTAEPCEKRPDSSSEAPTYDSVLPNAPLPVS